MHGDWLKWKTQTTKSPIWPSVWFKCLILTERRGSGCWNNLIKWCKFQSSTATAKQRSYLGRFCYSWQSKEQLIELTGTWGGGCSSPAESDSGWSWSTRSWAEHQTSQRSTTSPANRAPNPLHPPLLVHPVHSYACSGWPHRGWWKHRPALGSDSLGGCRLGSDWVRELGQVLGGQGQEGTGQWLGLVQRSLSLLPPMLHGCEECKHQEW